MGIIKIFTVISIIDYRNIIFIGRSLISIAKTIYILIITLTYWKLFSEKINSNNMRLPFATYILSIACEHA